MLNCPKCGSIFDEYSKWGPKKFCSRKCANSREQTPEIKERKSLKLRGRPCWNGHGFKKGFDPRRKIFTKKERLRGVESNKERLRKIYENSSCEQLGKNLRRRKILEEQQGKCLHCGINEWQGRPLILELDHIDGHKRNNTRNNLRVLCPNCHSQTPTFRNKKRATDGNGIPEPLKTDRFSVRV